MLGTGQRVKARRQRARPDMFRPFALLLLIGGALISFLPFLWMLLSAFKLPGEMDIVPPSFFPRRWVLDNLIWVWVTMNFPRLFANSMLVTVTSTLAGLYTSTLVGYVLAKFNFRGREVIFFLIVSQLFIPGQLGTIVLWFMCKRVGLLDSYAALIIPGLYSVFGIFLMRQYMHVVPNELCDAARIDGCSEIGIFHRVVLPNVGPALSALGIFVFMWNYDSFFWPLIVLNKPEMYTVPLGLAFFQGQFFMNLTRALAGTSVAVVPVLAIFVLFQRRIVEGITLTGLAGR